MKRVNSSQVKTAETRENVNIQKIIENYFRTLRNICKITNDKLMGRGVTESQLDAKRDDSGLDRPSEEYSESQ